MIELLKREEKLLSRTFSKRIAELNGFIDHNKNEEMCAKFRKEIFDIKRLYSRITDKPL